MPKNIVLLSDGTGNSAAKLAKTNVWRLYQSLDLSDPTQQIAYYDDGVGTSSFKPLAIIGGAFGYGLKRNILDLYTFLCRNYEPGDKIFCFGFSRGAFTARALTGLISFEGLAADSTEEGLRKKATTAYRHYRSERFHADIPIDKFARAIRDIFVGDKTYRAKYKEVDIDFLGVWDTVAAYGLPIDELTRALNWVWRLYPKDRNPTKQTRRICHAIAIDDERNTFHPMLFNEQEEPNSNQTTTNVGEERLSQVWFTGMHSNVGGGYPDDALASVSFEWMIGEAAAKGLILRPRISLDSPSRTAESRELVFLSNGGPPGKLYDSRRGLGGLYRYLPRRMDWISNNTVDKSSQVVIPRPKIHESVFQRIAQGNDSYAPIVLPGEYAVVQKSGAIVNSKMEHPTQAQSRVNEQESVWDLVWCKRVAYFTSILVAVVLLAFPAWWKATAACEGPFCFISPFINVAGGLLPSFLEPWIASYRSHPGWFAGFAILFGLLLSVGNKLQGRIFDRMRDIWEKRIQQPGVECRGTELPTNRLFRFRTHPAYLWFFRQMKRRILPALFGGVAVVAIAGSLTRLLFLSFSSAGGVCFPENAQALIATNSPCAATPYLLERGKKYKVVLTMKESLADDTISVKSFEGFDTSEMKWWVQPGIILRRHLSEAWFRPIARIGEQGTDEYVLTPDEGLTEAGSYTSTITARRDGRLYLYVNDAVLPVPNSWQAFYLNNRGTIEVKIQ